MISAHAALQHISLTVPLPIEWANCTPLEGRKKRFQSCDVYLLCRHAARCACIANILRRNQNFPAHFLKRSGSARQPSGTFFGQPKQACLAAPAASFIHDCDFSRSDRRAFPHSSVSRAWRDLACDRPRQMRVSAQKRSIIFVTLGSLGDASKEFDGSHSQG